MKKALIILLAVAFVAAFAMPAAAAEKAEWSFYGSARVQTIVYDDDENNAVVGGAPNGAAGFDDRDTIWTLQDSSRFGANVSAGDISGRVELRESTEWRVIWGEWDFGAGKLGVGKTYTPANMFYSARVGFNGENMLGTGGYYLGAKGMLRLRFQGIADMIDIDFALCQPAVLGSDGAGEDVAYIVGTDLDTTLPQVESRILFNWGPIQAEFGGAWVEVEDTLIVGLTEREFDLDAWAIHGGVKFAMGPFYANANAHTGENNSLLGQFVWDAANPTAVDNTGDGIADSITDADRWGWQAVIGFKLNDMLSFEGGYGEAEVESNIVGQDDDEVSTWYVQANISPVAGFNIIPEIGEVDYEDNFAGNDEGDTFYYGVYWMISF